ncbi:Rint-1 family protein [Mycena sanguinolenta]|uniref:Rint-1 family protein n=1 Tax=Mycena sanguinolenta TaxID=230812 RepID=A0A8H6XQ98_9AGAR|nr:Rint-1 family protein [Mycena sanguinolenta]
MVLARNLRQVFSPNAWDYHQELVENYRGVIRIDGLLGEKQLYIYDPKSLHQILVKDQDIFEEPAYVIKGTRVSFGEGLLSTLGEQHRKQRKILNPVFSVAHLRQMVPIFFDVGKRLRAALEARVQQGPREIDLLVWMTRTALELIGQAGLGHRFDDLVTDEVPAYIRSAKEMQTTMHKMYLAARYIMPHVANIGSPKFRRFVVNLIPWKTLHDGRDIVDTMYGTAVDIYNIKKKALETGDEAVKGRIEGKDLISVLMKDNSNASSDDRLSENEIIAQLNTLLFAATDTTSSALSRTLHVLAQRPDVQEKLRQEIRSARHEGDELSYNDLESLEYLDAVCRETLRLYPPVAFVVRTVRQDVALTTSTPITVNGSPVTEIPVPAETGIFVSILSANRNPAVWGPDVLEWKPERWLSPLPQSVIDAKVPGIYANLMTFIGGGRACIGFKFSQLEMKVVLCLLVERFKFSLSDKEISWSMGSIAVPSVDGNKHQLPLKVELAA